MRFLVSTGTLLTLLLAGLSSAAQQSSSQDSLAAASQRARQERKQQVKTVKVWDNDNIPKRPDEITVLNEPASEASASADAAAPSKDGKPATPAKDAAADKKTALTSDLAAAKESLQTLQNDFDILKRKFVLDQQTYYGRPNYSTDKDGIAALNDQQGQIDAKQLEMGAAQQKIADLQAQLNALTEAKSPQK